MSRLKVSTGMRVLHISPDLSPKLGGTTAAALELCRALVRKGTSTTLLSTNLDEVGRWRPWYVPRTLKSSTELRDGLRIHYFPTRWPSRSGFSPELSRHIREHIREFDLVHIHRLYRFSTLAAARYARRSSTPYVISPHGVLHPYHRRRRRLRKQLYDRLIQTSKLNHAAAICYTSKYELDLAATLRLKAPSVVIPTAINPQDFENLPARGSFRKQYPHLAGKDLVVFLGRLAPQKGLDLLIQAFSLVARRAERSHLVIAGPDEDGHAKVVQSWLHRWGVADRTTVIGPVFGQRKLELLADTDVWALSSYAEGLSIAVIEALACRLPVVVSDHVGIPEEIAEAKAGLVVPCEVPMLADAILSLLRNKALGRELGDAGWRLANSRYSWDAAASQMIGLYETLAAPRLPRAAQP